MKTTSQKNSFGGGYGINRNVSAGNALRVAEPPMGHVTVRPGGFSRKEVGMSGKKHFSGAKVISGKKS